MKPENFYTGLRKPVEAYLPVVTVGINEGMFRGADHFAIQAAVDYVARHGGGTVQILPGKYILRNAIFLPSFVTLMGSGDETVLEKHASRTVALAEDCDWYSWSVVVEDASSFAVGDGISLSSQRPDAGKGLQVTLHTITQIEENRLYLDGMPRMNHWLGYEAKVASTHSLIDAQKVAGITIKDIRLKGNSAENEYLNGNGGAAIFMQEGENVHIQNVTIENFNGDGISWQIVHDVCVENCVISNMAVLGLHPGSGSQRPVMRNNKVSNCDIGIFWCWGVCNGIAENNRITNCKKHGISTGHRDNDNIIRGNTISGSGESGIYFRPERSADHTSNRVLIENNFINAPAESTGISVARGAEDTIIRNNKIVATDAANAIIIDDEAVRTIVEENAAD
jgi:parallel beta-helix repeat protein